MLQGVLFLEGCYEVHYDGTATGKVQMIRQGLYYRIICRCCLPDHLVCRLYAVWENGRENLGVVVPEGDGFVLDRKIPAKKLSENGLHFILSTGYNKANGKLVKVCPEEPFLYIDRLKNAFLDTENGKISIRIEENPEAV